MKNIEVIFVKQIKDTLKNKAVLIQFIMFPVIALIMNGAIQIDGMPKDFFTVMFAGMYIGMAPLVSMASIISEEKEQNTLRVLFMSNVKPEQYIIGVGGYIFVACLAGAAVFCIAGGYTGKAAVTFMLLMIVGIITSMLIGATIGAWGKNQMTATSLTVPIMMIFSFLPMLSMFNDSIKKIARVTYSQQISLLMGELQEITIKPENIVVIGGNMLLALLLFLYAYQCKIVKQK